MKLTTRQVAERLHVGVSTVSAWARKGKLPMLQKGNGTKRIQREIDEKVFQEWRKSETAAELFRTIERGWGGRRRQVPLPSLPVTQAHTQGPRGLLERLEAQLQTVDEKIDRLLAIWS